ncbi:MAG: tol-pal system protein YbgF [Legionellales bacterium]
MIHCKRYIIATCFTLMLPLTCWSEAPVVDDSDNFAIMEEHQATESPGVVSEYGDSQAEQGQVDRVNNSAAYQSNTRNDDGPALVKEDNAVESNNDSGSDFNDNAKLISKVQSLQQEVQELRGQLEVQAHDLKLLQQQQVAFYKDLDARLGAVSGTAPVKSIPSKPTTSLDLNSKVPARQASMPAAVPKKVAQTSIPPKPVMPVVSRMNPADEQIGYLAAYELVKSKRYDDAVNAMQTFVQKYPTGGYTANAEYWLGELYLVKKDYPKAIEHFDVVLKQYPSSSKSAASTLKAGYAYAATGNNQEARKLFQQVVITYPNTPTARLANSKLEAINAL